MTTSSSGDVFDNYRQLTGSFKGLAKKIVVIVQAELKLALTSTFIGVSSFVYRYGVTTSMEAKYETVLLLLFTCIFIYIVLLLVESFLFEQSVSPMAQSFLKTLDAPSSIANVADTPLLREENGVTVIASKMNFENKDKVLKSYELKEVQKHKSKNDIWIIMNGYVFDVTSFLDRHPGGDKVMLTMGGRDCTDAMTEFHPDYVYNIIPKFLIGKLATPVPSTKKSSVESNNDSKHTAIIEDYRKIRQIFLQMGLFETDMMYYYKKFALLSIVFFAVIGMVVLSDSFVVHMVAAAVLGIFWQQIAFIGHDSGHNAVTHKRNLDYFVTASLGDFLGGISMGWWKLSHNVHHVNCNSINDDPDIQHLPVFAVSEKMLDPFVSTYHNKIFYFDAIAQILVSYQHLLFYPIMLVARVNLYLQSWLLLINTAITDFKERNNPKKKLVNYQAEYKIAELLCCAGFFLWIGILLSFFSTWVEMALFVLVSHAVAGVLHIQICLSHFTMKTYPGQFSKQQTIEDKSVAEENITENWVLLQLYTTLNVDCDPKLDFFHGGLHFQIEHHLFPRLPRHNLRIASLFVKKLCQKHNIPYRALSFYDANVELIERMKETATAARKHIASAKNGEGIKRFVDSELYEGLNCIG